MEINELLNLIANVGFPVAISAYLLVRLEKQIMNLTYSINKLNTIVSTKLGIVIDNIKSYLLSEETKRGNAKWQPIKNYKKYH